MSDIWKMETVKDCLEVMWSGVSMDSDKWRALSLVLQQMLIISHGLDKRVGGEERFTYASTQETECAVCGKRKHTPLRVDGMGGYVCLTCIDDKLCAIYGELSCK